jgi:hypothetical protein
MSVVTVDAVLFRSSISVDSFGRRWFGRLFFRLLGQGFLLGQIGRLRAGA